MKKIGMFLLAVITLYVVGYSGAGNLMVATFLLVRLLDSERWIVLSLLIWITPQVINAVIWFGVPYFVDVNGALGLERYLSAWKTNLQDPVVMSQGILALGLTFLAGYLGHKWDDRSFE